MTKRDITRVGDTVRIVTTERFVRCGYPLSQEDVIQEIYSEHWGELTVFLEKLGWNRTNYWGDSKTDKKSTHNVIREIAYLVLKHRKFGGNVRSIHTTPLKMEVEGVSFKIQKIKYVKTGEYYSPVSSFGMDGYDYEPGGLTDQKTHKILYVVPDDDNLWSLPENEDVDWLNVDEQDGFWIENNNVEKVRKGNICRE